MSETRAKKVKGKKEILVNALSNTFNSTNGFSSGVEKNGINQTILQITEIGGSIGAKIKRMVLTPLGSSNISRIPDPHRSDYKRL